MHTEEKKDLFKRLIKEGYNKKLIIVKLNLTEGQYRYLLGKLNLKTNKFTSLQIIDKENELAKCSECNRILKIKENFTLVTKKTGYTFYQTYCYDCRYDKRNKHYNNNRVAFLKDTYSSLKSSAKTKNVKFNISQEEFINQYNNQNGKCFYTDINMICKYGAGTDRYALSVDKIIPKEGYIKGNLVFCCYKINTCKLDLSLDEIKQWMPGWYDRIFHFKNEHKL